ncbi:MAG: sodium/proton-translocating pyrophosphatase, partial [Gammaproteobacteria bacterium]|nr:sodium/proton-translocating pyrophosphatase [Gammaproteobacteria bacterium]
MPIWGKVKLESRKTTPRNPGVIADNVGDNVGDVAGRGSDIFESYWGAMIATIAIASTLGLSHLSGLAPGLDEERARAALMFLPRWVRAATGLVASPDRYLCRARDVRETGSVAPGVVAPLPHRCCSISGVFRHRIGGRVRERLVVGKCGAPRRDANSCFGLVTSSITPHLKPVVRIAEAGQTGPATVMIT